MEDKNGKEKSDDDDKMIPYIEDENGEERLDNL